MQIGKPSRTARAAAAHRAAHQILEQGRIFSDPLALRILGEDAEAIVRHADEKAFWSTLGYIASLAGGAHVVFDYGDRPDSLSPASRALHDQRAAYVEAEGEKWISYFDAGELSARLVELGFAEVEDLGPAQIVARYFPNRKGITSDRGGHVVHAATIRSTPL